jgi:hypothetical protein
MSKVSLKTVRKAVGALVAGVIILVARGVLPDAVDVYLEALTPLLVAFGVYVAPANAPKGA